MSSQAALTRAQQFVHELNRGEFDSIERYLTPEFFAHTPQKDEPTQIEVYAQLLNDLRTGFPDLHMELKELRYDADLLRGQVGIEGTNNGPIWGAPASGNSVEWNVEIALRSVQDRFAISLEDVNIPDLMNVLRQFEILPPAEKMNRPHKYPVVIPEIVLKAIFTGQIADKPCSHLGMIKVTETTVDYCEQCVASGDIWPALRLCLTCGFVGCCDTSRNKHAKRHFEETGHPLMRSIRLNERWVWCYEDNALFEGRVLDKHS